MYRTILCIGLGSFSGGILRYLLLRLIQNNSNSTFPFGTLLVNIIGCFAIGLIYGLLEQGKLMNTDLKLFLTVGLCGGFTTFSTFMADNLDLCKSGDVVFVTLYLAASLLGGFLMLYFGQLSIKAI